MPEGAGLFRRGGSARLTGTSGEAVLKQRTALDVHPRLQPPPPRIDTCAAEFASPTAYMYSTYETPFLPASSPTRRRSRDKKEGRHPRRRAVTASARASSSTIAAAMPPSALADAGFESIMVNCKIPETVSTDYDTSDRLYFEPLTDEDVLEIPARRAGPRARIVGVIVQFGGQTPLKLADALEKAGIPILGTAPT